MNADTTQLDIKANRGARKWSLAELFGRLCWELATPLFRCSPRCCWEWRCFLLRIFGARIGKSVRIHPDVKIFIPWNLHIGDWSAVGFSALLYNLGPLRIGQRVTISQRAHLCGGTHDHRQPSMPLIKSPIEIGDEAWICADAFVGPGVTVGRGAVVAARAVVPRSVGDWIIVAGNPSVEIGKRDVGSSV